MTDLDITYMFLTRVGDVSVYFQGRLTFSDQFREKPVRAVMTFQYNGAETKLECRSSHLSDAIFGLAERYREFVNSAFIAAEGIQADGTEKSITDGIVIGSKLKEVENE